MTDQQNHGATKEDLAPPSTRRHEVLDATDQEIEEAVLFAEPNALRGLMYQLTGDESLAEMEVISSDFGFLNGIMVLADPTDVATVQKKAVEFLKSYRDSGADDISIGPEDRLQRSLSLAAGTDIPDRDMGLWIEQLSIDGWERALEWPAQPDPRRLQDFHVLVIGAGMGGLNAAIQLKHAGIPHTVVEKNAGVGGTWYENRYPGARVDTPSRGYTHCYGVDWFPPYAFCPQEHNEKYLNWIADAHCDRDAFEFNTEAKSVIWDEDAKLWEVQAVGPDGPRVWRVNAVITAVGFLSRPSVPDIEGAADFAGEAFHTARWPSGLDLEGKRVAVVGSGCSGYQLLPEVVEAAEQTYLFQRTPSWAFETTGYLSQSPPQINWLDRNFPYYVNFLRYRVSYIFGPNVLGEVFTKHPETIERIRQKRVAFMGKKFADRPDLFEKMLPANPPLSSRPVLIDEDWSVYDALLREDTTLVTEAIQRITPAGIVTADGVEHPVDVIAFATGFRANDYLWPMEIRGRGGLTTEELWEKDGARAYIGTMLPGFPNFFMIYGPNTSPTGGLGVADMHELEARFALQCIAHLIVENKSAIDVTREAYEQYNREVDEAEIKKTFIGEPVKNYYTNEYGRSAVNSPFDGRQSWDWWRDPSGRYAATAAGPAIYPDSEVRPYFGADLEVE